MAATWFQAAEVVRVRAQLADVRREENRLRVAAAQAVSRAAELERALGRLAPHHTKGAS